VIKPSSRRHFPLPPFAKNAKDGAPTLHAAHGPLEPLATDHISPHRLLPRFSGLRKQIAYGTLPVGLPAEGIVRDSGAYTLGIVQRADSLSNDAVEAPNQIDLILCHSLTIVREWHFGKMPLLRLSAVSNVMARNI